MAYSLGRRMTFWGLSRHVFLGPSKAMVFLFHDVSEPSYEFHSPIYSTSPASFERQIDFIARTFHVVSLSELVTQPRSADRPLAALTFDDGFRTILSEALPRLATRDLPFTVFVNRSAIEHDQLFNGRQGRPIQGRSQKRIFLNAQEVRELHQMGVGIGSHSADHRVLSECDTPTLHEAIVGCKNFLEDLLSQSIEHFAIPYGKKRHYDQRALDLCTECGLKYVYTTNPTYYSIQARPALIPRLSLLTETPSEIAFLANRPMLKRVEL